MTATHKTPSVSQSGEDRRARASEPAPDPGGWASAAMAIHAIRRMPTPVLLRIDVVGVGSIMIDPRREGYTGLPVELLPARPSVVRVETHPADASTAPPDQPQQDLEAVLWFIGINAFDGERASWLWPGDRYHLTRWPRVTRIAIEADTLTMFAALGSTTVTADELADVAEAPLEHAQRTINALSLMGLLDASSTTPPPVPPRAAQRAEVRGLFGRLRESLGF